MCVLSDCVVRILKPEVVLATIIRLNGQNDVLFVEKCIRLVSQKRLRLCISNFLCTFKTFRAVVYKVHRAVIFVIAQLSCFDVHMNCGTFYIATNMF